MQEILFLLCLFAVSGLYASIGHGGASGYLALMVLFAFPYPEIRITALCLNLVVAGISAVLFLKRGYFRWRLIYPFVITSLPAAFLGGLLPVSPIIFRVLLGAFLVFAVVKMAGRKPLQTEDRPVQLVSALFLGAAIGFLSGLIGIGGGIILSPVILLLGWGNVKETATASALFIWVNSASGLTARLLSGETPGAELISYIAAVSVGAVLGAYFGSHRWSGKVLRIILALVLTTAGIKLLWYGNTV